MQKIPNTRCPAISETLDTAKRQAGFTAGFSGVSRIIPMPCICSGAGPPGGQLRHCQLSRNPDFHNSLGIVLATLEKPESHESCLQR
ncbi:hypothetical protein QUF80_10750 [Desulfococcaceae bacterium HSG8]|nr:hypothetical protein [Desulfococcaceae bacterium HSG8]